MRLCFWGVGVAAILLTLLPGAARAQMPPEVARALESEANYVAFMQEFRDAFPFSTGHKAYTCRQYLDLRRRLPEASVADEGWYLATLRWNEYVQCSLADFLHRVAPAPQPCYRPDNLGQELFERMEAGLVTVLAPEGRLYKGGAGGQAMTFAEYLRDWEENKAPSWMESVEFSIQAAGFSFVVQWEGMPGRRGEAWGKHALVAEVDADGNGQCDWVMGAVEDNLEDAYVGPTQRYSIVLNPESGGLMKTRRLFMPSENPAVDFILPGAP